MQYSPNKHHRRSIRLVGYDYSSPGAYLVTLCAYKKRCVFGEIKSGKIKLNDAGRIVRACWEDLPVYFPGVLLDEFVVMPNHIHGIIVISNRVGATHASPLQMVEPSTPRGPARRSIGAIIGSFKSAVTKRVNKRRNAQGQHLWQRNYYEHVIRNDREMALIRQYIYTNPVCWDNDEEHPANRV